jgi:uncharacterized FAD-dependent dehydrogenase
MALILRNVILQLNEDDTQLLRVVATRLSISPDVIKDLRVLRAGIDARKKPHVRRVFTVAFCVPDEERVLQRFADLADLQLEEPPAVLPSLKMQPGHRVLVVGMGPAGLFAALQLAHHGANVTLIERGEPVEDRSRSVESFWRSGVLRSESNPQFGEGGAGTFSDGKLTTRVNSSLNRLVLQTFVDCGAPPAILYEAKPHLGTDVLRQVLIRFRQMLQNLGVDIHFSSCLDGIELDKERRVKAGVVNGANRISCDSLVLAPGHSARDTYALLQQHGVAMEQKAFAIGLRVEHPTELINMIQYGLPSHPHLPTADYALRYNDPQTGRGCYSFCMCPGGEVIIAASEPGGVVVNGMSHRKRTAGSSNSALVTTVTPVDFDGSDPLAGVRFQRCWEEAAFCAGGGDFHAPAQNLMAFLGHGSGPLRSSCRPGVREADLSMVLPRAVADVLRRGLPQFDRQMRGFVTREATLVGVETRTSAPLRILRDETTGESLSHSGLYPVGEGAGYAGGIMSAALDGIRVAERITAQHLDGD